MTDFKACDIVTNEKGIDGVVVRCNSRVIEIDTTHGDVHRFTRDIFFRLCTPDEVREFWTDRRNIAVTEMNRAQLVAEDAALALYALENDK